jgi:hypothetical protein
MKKLYGCINNRLEEGHKWVEEIKVGTLLTQYLWSDRHAFEVTQVINQKHIFIRRLKAIRNDKNGMSDSQEYTFKQDLTNKEIELIFRYNKWQSVTRYNIQTMNKRAAIQKLIDNHIINYEANLF